MMLPLDEPLTNSAGTVLFHDSTGGTEPLDHRPVVIDLTTYKTRQNQLRFSQATATGTRMIPPSAGPRVDTGAPYSSIGLFEFQERAPRVLPRHDGTLELMPGSLIDCRYWNYETVGHSSTPREIIGFVILTANASYGSSVNIRHLVLGGSSEWVIGKT